MITIVDSVLFLVASGNDVLGYIGPGIGVGALGAILGIAGSVFLAFFALIWYPLKRLFKRKKRPGNADQENSQ